MGFRFRQRIKVFPGVHVNLTARGISSVSIGGPGATVNIGENMRVAATAGLPGTGLSYRQIVHPGRQRIESESSVAEVPLVPKPDLPEPPEQISAAEWSESSMEELQQIILEAHQERTGLEAELAELQAQVQIAEHRFETLNKWYRRWFQRNARDVAAADLTARRDELQAAIDVLKGQGVVIDWTVPERLKHLFQVFMASMRKVAQQQRIWHIRDNTQIDRVQERTAYGLLTDREQAELTFGRPSFLPARQGDPYAQVPCLRAASGFSLYFFPTFIAVLRDGEFGLIKPTSLLIDMELTDFVEPEVPLGAKVTGQTWRYVNKDGTPDRRYRDNPNVPIVTYEQLRLSSGQAFNELFLFTQGAVSFSTWVDVCDWFADTEKRKTLESLPVTPVTWKLRNEADAYYITAPYQGDELIGFGITHKDAELWVCLSVGHMGVELQPSTNIRYWLDDEPLVVGVLFDSRKISKDSAAQRAWPQDSEYPEPSPFKRLATARELFVSVETDGKPVFEIRVALAGVGEILDSIAPDRMS